MGAGAGELPHLLPLEGWAPLHSCCQHAAVAATPSPGCGGLPRRIALRPLCTMVGLQGRPCCNRRFQPPPPRMRIPQVNAGLQQYQAARLHHQRPVPKIGCPPLHH